MRRLLLVVCFGCGSTSKPPAVAKPVATAAPKVEPFWSTPKPAEPKAAPLALLATAHDLTMLVTEDGHTACRTWHVEQSKQRDDDTAYLVSGDERIAFENHGNALVLKSRSITERHAGRTMDCNSSFEVKEIDAGLDVDGATWFTDEADCAFALDHKARVATDLEACEWKPEANLQQQAASQRKFEAMLRFGGAAFAIVEDACVATHATPSNASTTSLTGSLWTEQRSTDVRGRPIRGKTSYGYDLPHDGLSIVLTGPSSSWSDGSSMGMICGDEMAISYGRDSVELGQTHYLSLASCRAALAKERTRKQWLATGHLHDPDAVAAIAPSIGGC